MTEAPILPPFRRFEIDGLRVHWYPGRSPHVAALLFRVGICDEDLPSRGLTHLVEHLAMKGVDDTVDSNAFVDTTRTVFHCRGTLAQIEAFMAHIVGQLADLPTHLIPAERRILATEAIHRDETQAGGMSLRYGARGFGLTDYEEFGVEAADVASVRAWARSRFSLENAVLVVSADPGAIRWPTLPRGVPHTVPATEPLPMTLPASVRGAPGGVSIGVVGPRSAALSMAWQIVQRRALRALRHESAIAYSVIEGYERLGLDQVHATMSIRCQEQATRAVFLGLERVLDGLAEAGPDPDEIRTLTDLRRSRLADEMEWPGMLDLLGSLELDGAAGIELPTLVDEWTMVTPDGIAGALREVLPSSILIADLEMAGERYAKYPETFGPVIEGRRSRPIDRRDPHRLVSSTVGIAQVVGAVVHGSVGFEDCAAVLAEPGRRLLIGRDGTRIDVRAWAWNDGADLINLIDRQVAPDRFVIQAAEGVTLPLARPPGTWVDAMGS